MTSWINELSSFTCSTNWAINSTVNLIGFEPMTLLILLWELNILWSDRRDSDSQQPTWRAGTLPIELLSHIQGTLWFYDLAYHSIFIAVSAFRRKGGVGLIPTGWDIYYLMVTPIRIELMLPPWKGSVLTTWPRCHFGGGAPRIWTEILLQSRANTGYRPALLPLK